MRGDNFTIAEAFKANGYATGQFGKWHLGDNYPMRPMDQGFDEVVGLGCGAVGQIGDYWGNDYFDDTYLVGDKWKKFDGYCTDVWFDEAMSFMDGVLTDAGGNKPFFVYLATNAPHGPYLVGPEWKEWSKVGRGAVASCQLHKCFKHSPSLPSMGTHVETFAPPAFLDSTSALRRRIFFEMRH